MKLTWLGHSCFKIEENGFTLILDPYSNDTVPGYRNLKEEADMVESPVILRYIRLMSALSDRQGISRKLMKRNAGLRAQESHRRH